MELCKKCNGKHDLKKGCLKPAKKGDKLEKEIGTFGGEDSRASAPRPPLAAGVNNGGLGASIAAGLSGSVRKAEGDTHPKVGAPKRHTFSSNPKAALKDHPAAKPKLPSLKKPSLPKKPSGGGSAPAQLQLSEKKSLEKAKVDEGKSKDDKVAAREDRNVRTFANKKPNAPRPESPYSPTINKPAKDGYLADKGVSQSGKLARDSKDLKSSGATLGGLNSDQMMDNSKKIASRTLSGIKESKSPNLPKSENGKANMEKSMKPGMSFNDLKKSELDKGMAEKAPAANASAPKRKKKNDDIIIAPAADNSKHYGYDAKGRPVGDKSVKGSGDNSRNHFTDEHEIHDSEAKSVLNRSEFANGGSFNDLRKREQDIMRIEEEVGSLAAHLKDVLKKIK